MLCKLSEEDIRQRVCILIDTEKLYLPRSDYLDSVQTDGMKEIWRSKVCSWLLEFEDSYGITQDTITVACNYMDRYLSQVSTKMGILQLIAMGAIFVAAKLHETYPISMTELRDLADGIYLESDIKLMELELLRIIDWKLNPVTPQCFVNHIVQYIPNVDLRSSIIEESAGFLDVIIPEYRFLCYRPSVQAVAAILCSFETSALAPEVRQHVTGVMQKFGFFDDGQVFDCRDKMLHEYNSYLQPPIISIPEPLEKRDRDSESPTGVDQLANSLQKSEEQQQHTWIHIDHDCSDDMDIDDEIRALKHVRDDSFESINQPVGENPIRTRSCTY